MKFKQGGRPAKAIKLGHTQEKDGRWQVVFKMDGKDYCRETYDGEAYSFSEIMDLTYDECITHGLSGATIERW